MSNNQIKGEQAEKHFWCVTAKRAWHKILQFLWYNPWFATHSTRTYGSWFIWYDSICFGRYSKCLHNSLLELHYSINYATKALGLFEFSPRWNQLRYKWNDQAAKLCNLIDTCTLLHLIVWNSISHHHVLWYSDFNFLEYSYFFHSSMPRFTKRYYIAIKCILIFPEVL